MKRSFELNFEYLGKFPLEKKKHESLNIYLIRVRMGYLIKTSPSESLALDQDSKGPGLHPYYFWAVKKELVVKRNDSR